MRVIFIEGGDVVSVMKVDIIPDNEDRVSIRNSTYRVIDRYFHLGIDTYVNIYLEKIGDK